MRLVLLILLCTIPACAQFRKIEITFQGVGCSSCVESLPDRLRRVRGVESVDVDAAKSRVTLHLGDRNRVRLEQIRDFIQQDGTKVSKASVDVTGELSETGGKWMLSLPNVSTQYRIDAPGQTLTPGTWRISGETSDAAADPIVLRVTAIEKPS